MKFLRATVVLVLIFCCALARAADSRDSAPPSDVAVDSARKVVFDYCFAPIDAAGDPSKFDARIKACNVLLTMLKTGADESNQTSKGRYDLGRAQWVDSQVKSWGAMWRIGLYVVDAIGVIMTVIILYKVLRADEHKTLLREPSPGGFSQEGKFSFSRLIGLLVGLTTFFFVILLTNICLTHLFLTDKMPDQLGSIYAASVGTLFTAFVPYLVNQLSTPRPTSPP